MASNAPSTSSSRKISAYLESLMVPSHSTTSSVVIAIAFSLGSLASRDAGTGQTGDMKSQHALRILYHLDDSRV